MTSPAASRRPRKGFWRKKLPYRAAASSGLIVALRCQGTSVGGGGGCSNLCFVPSQSRAVLPQAKSSLPKARPALLPHANRQAPPHHAAKHNTISRLAFALAISPAYPFPTGPLLIRPTNLPFLDDGGPTMNAAAACTG